MIQLGLIGSGISRSSAPRLHRFLGELCGVEVDYQRIDSAEIPEFDFVAALHRCVEAGYRGVNVTHPFKERVRPLVNVTNSSVSRIGAINTVTFDTACWQGNNTDFSGFAKAFRHRFAGATPGRVLMIGAGGVGKAMAFALGELGAEEVMIFDIASAQSNRLVSVLKTAGIHATAVREADLKDAIRSADGLVNGTPIGMWQHPGNPFPEDAMGGQRWAFDAVYTPLETEFLKCAKAGSLEIMSGYDLFLFQGFDAFTIFTGIEVDPASAMAKFPPPEQNPPPQT